MLWTKKIFSRLISKLNVYFQFVFVGEIRAILNCVVSDLNRVHNCLFLLKPQELIISFVKMPSWSLILAVYCTQSKEKNCKYFCKICNFSLGIDEFRQSSLKIYCLKTKSRHTVCWPERQRYFTVILSLEED